MTPPRDYEPCSYCGNEPDECVCEMAPDFPDDLLDGLESDDLDWDYYEEFNNHEVNGQEDSSGTDVDEG